MFSLFQCEIEEGEVDCCDWASVCVRERERNDVYAEGFYYYFLFDHFNQFLRYYLYLYLYQVQAYALHMHNVKKFFPSLFLTSLKAQRIIIVIFRKKKHSRINHPQAHSINSLLRDRNVTVSHRYSCNEELFAAVQFIILRLLPLGKLTLRSSLLSLLSSLIMFLI